VTIAAFLSYAHEDDDADNGGIQRLGRSLRAEYELLTGESLDLFVDRTSTRWADEWRARIGGALDASTFLMPVLTPRYFTRSECRRELATYLGTRSAQQLLLPILYVQIPDFQARNPDDLIARVSQTQYVDWTKHRLEDVTAPAYRAAINRLACRLLDARPARERVIVAVTSRGQLQDAIAKTESGFQALREAAMKEQLFAAQLLAAQQVFDDHRFRPWPESPDDTENRRRDEVTRCLPHEERRLPAAIAMLTAVETLNPLIAEAVQLVQTRRTSWSDIGLLDIYVQQAISLAVRPIKVRKPQWTRSPQLRRTFEDELTLTTQADQLVLEATELILKWNDRLDSLRGQLAHGQL
jgi:hypothetical protein